MEWDTLPDHIIVLIFKYLSLNERYNSSLVCKCWNNAFQIPFLWRRFCFKFVQESDKRKMRCVDKYGSHFRELQLLVDQSGASNRRNACQVLDTLARTQPRNLERLQMHFIAENPLFYAGREFIDSLGLLFGSCSVSNVAGLCHVDLRELPIAFENGLIDILSENCRGLLYLNILNKSLVCKVSSECIVRLINRCQKLQDLQLYSSSLSDECLMALTESGRQPLQHLKIVCRREEKYLKELSGTVWSSVTKAQPGLRVTLVFDHTCPHLKIREVMKAEIPVEELRLETFSFICEEIVLATQYYSSTLKKVVLQTRPSNELNNVILQMSTYCPLLNSLNVFCILKKETIDAVLEMHPEMRSSRKFVLKHIAEPWMESWIAGMEEAP